ncbi:unnamed protein product [Dracunculus medinensis]|uniref:SDR family NAD(P)-dependent oxidoreductase n=1 Tax=Dracunculus medinensis TaxID=318479 RepID=A0A0N4UNT8_DRAME|nr:unnamed protein product [Dracunculus medinensis]
MKLHRENIQKPCASSGIGLETARSLALHGAHIVMANRDFLESKKIRDQIVKDKADAAIDIIIVNLDSLNSVKGAAEEPLHALILNAGVFNPSAKKTLDGFETAFGVNYLSHFYLIQLLLEKLRQSAPARIVVVSSISHNHTGVKSEWPLEEKMKTLIPGRQFSEAFCSIYKHYAVSKLDLNLMAVKLSRDEKINNIYVYILHPGTMIGTGIARNFGFLWQLIAMLTKPFTKSLQQGAATTIFCAVSDDLRNNSGHFFQDCQVANQNSAQLLMSDEELQDLLWNKTMDIINEFERKLIKS